MQVESKFQSVAMDEPKMTSTRIATTNVKHVARGAAIEGLFRSVISFDSRPG
jgi:hypothetical protein